MTPLPSTARKGMALVITLGALVLVTVLVLAFFSRAQLNRQIAFSSTNLAKTDLLARSALDLVVGDLRDEIITNSTVTNSSGVPIYLPLSAADMLPRSSGISNATGSLLKVSSNSSNSISTPSRNGRSLSALRWFGSGGPQLGSQATLPTWSFITRGNGAQIPTITEAKDPANGNYVIGRCAYSVYNTAGLFDANVAGFPALAAVGASSRSSTAQADLTPLGINSNDLALWRNAVTGLDAATFAEWATGLPRSSGTTNAAALAAAASGHRSIANGDNAVLSRRDLLRNPHLAGAANFLTHFSRSVDAPSWTPINPSGTSINYETAADTAAAFNRNLPNVRWPTAANIVHYRDDGSIEPYSATETTHSYKAQPGDPLIQRRFSLAKLAWITHAGPKAGISDAAIQACFGLLWSNTDKTWKYIGDSATVQSSIKTLDQVAAANREPNLFELLQAGVLNGSLGKSSGASNNGSTLGAISGADGNKCYQIIQIGANLIDQADSDSYPTTIIFNDIPFYGIEDLPYFNKILFKNYAATKTGNHYNPPYHVYLLYELWNPHQAASTSAAPTQFRIRINDEATYKYSVISQVGASKVTTDVNLTPQPLPGVDGDPLMFSADSFSSDVQTSYREPRLIRTGAPATLRPDLGGTVNAVRLPDITGSFPTNAMWICHNISHGVFTLEYQDGSGWHTYSTFLGQEGVGGVNGIGGLNVFFPALTMTVAQGISDLTFIGKADPRTFRFDATLNTTLLAAGDISWHSGSGALAWLYANTYKPNFIPTATVTNAYLSLLAANNANIKDPNGNSYPYIDTDNITRGVDAWYGPNPYEAGVSTARPVILNRPFRNVGELGYVFRGMPFKSLDFFTDQSADGALLDLFAICDEPAIVAGRVQIQTLSEKTAEGLFSGAENVSSAPDLAASLQTYLAANIQKNLAQLPSFLFSNPPGVGNVKTLREAPLRALASTAQSRTWNLLVDIVAQSGRYPADAASLDNFVVEGEKRFWLSLAIDRFTGRVIEQQLEPVDE